MHKPRLRIWVDKTLPIFLCLLLLILPFRWVIAIVLACAVHEIGHIFALKFFGYPIRNVCLNASGAAIITDPMEPKDELVCAIAGPLFGSFLVFSAIWFPELAVCALIQTINNLLPIYPGDGGRALRCIIKSERLINFVECITMSAILALGLWAWKYWKLGPILLVAGVCRIFPAVRKK